MSHFFNGVFGLITQFFDSVSNTNHTPPHHEAFDPLAYNPIYGNPGQVDDPGLSLSTKYAEPHPDIQHFNGDMNTHVFAADPFYRQAYLDRKMSNYYSASTQRLDPYYMNGPPRQQVRIQYLTGDTISDRDPSRRSRQNTFYGTAKRESQL